MEQCIAYRDKDLEGDVWSENSFFFKDDDSVNKFFTPDNPDLISIYTDGDGEELNDFEIHNSNPAGRITSVTFNTKYAGDVRISEMNAGYLID
jgi:hypothetical protein